MKIWRLLGMTALAFAILAGAAMAHEKWFYEGPPKPTRWELYFQARPLTFTAGTLAVFGLACMIWRLRSGQDFVPGPEAFGARPERRMAFTDSCRRSSACTSRCPCWSTA